MTTQLEIIMAETRLAVDRRKSSADLQSLERRAAEHVPRGFEANLRRVSTERPAIIAELKKASPSKGLLRADYRPAEIARCYDAAGAAAISVLTDEAFFQGSLDHLAEVASVVAIPVLRKDFLLDPFQILEARAAGADAILLIVAAHADAVLRALYAEALAAGLDVLCEVHDGTELERAIDLGAQVIGVNCRNLKTLAMDLGLHERLVAAMPAGVVRVAESGIASPADVERLGLAGYNAFLVGETLMRRADQGVALAELMGKATARAY